jgi:MFS family permease
MNKEEKESLRIKRLKYKGRKESIKEGIFASVRTSFGDSFLSPFAVAINTSNFMVALMSAIIGFLGPVSQIFGSKLIEKYSRKKIILKAVVVEALIWIPISSIAILFYKNILMNVLPVFFLLLFSFYVIVYSSMYPAWFSWIGDLVSSKHRGRWFSKRNLIVGFTGVVLSILASFFLQYLKKVGFEMTGFFILFLLAFVFRMLCFGAYKKQYEPKLELKKDGQISFWEFLVTSPKNNMGRFTLFRALFSFATAISSSLLVIYLLRILNFSYPLYMGISMAGVVFSLITMELWGKFADKYGSYKTIIFASVIIPITPILWMIYSSPIYLILVPSLLGGIAWAGFNLAEGNFIYDNVSQEKRGTIVSYHNMLVGIGTFLGAGLGAILIKFLNTTIEPIIVIFFIGAFARMIFVVLWTPKIKETKKKKHFHGTKSLKNLILKQGKSTLHEEVHEIMSIKKYLMEK